MIFEGTKFEKLESSIRDEINRKRRRGTSTAPHDSYDATEKKRTKQNRDGKVKGSNTPKHRVEETSSLVKKNVTKISNISKQDATKTSDSVPASNDEFSNDRTVYVQGLPFTSTEEDISLFFKNVGQIISIRLPKWHDSGKAKGYCHVEFKSSESASKALELTGEYMQDRYLTIDKPQVPRVLQPRQNAVVKPVGCRTVYLKNLPYDIEEEELSLQFRVYGPIKSIRLAAWNHTGKMKGFGYVEYKREDSAETAVNKSGSISLHGRKVLVDYETGAPKASYKPKKSDANAQTKR